MADAADLKSAGAILVGSSPTPGTRKMVSNFLEFGREGLSPRSIKFYGGYLSHSKAGVRFAMTDKEEHFADLTNLANFLLVGDLDWGMEGVANTSESKSGDNDELTKEQLSFRLQYNIQFAIGPGEPWFFYDCFVPHLLIELPEEMRNKWFWTIVEEQPYRLINTLRILAARKTFKGTCPVCEDC